jgi:regulator of sirC expression with transglutaminase-like and TPR domain
MSLHEFLQGDPACTALVEGAVLAVGPMLEDPDPAPVCRTVAGWADALAGLMPLPWNLHSAVDVLNDYLFHHVGLQGDRDTYDDPANAALPEVIRRRRGLPITLSILWIDVARRLGFQAVGAGLPGHFISGIRTDAGVLYFDPFGEGRAVGEEDAAWLVEQSTGGRAAFEPSMLAPLSNRAILASLVRNLHVRFARTAGWDEALWTSTHLVLLSPEESGPYRDRAFVHFKRGEMEAGLADLREALRLAPGDPDLARWLERIRRE